MDMSFPVDSKKRHYILYELCLILNGFLNFGPLWLPPGAVFWFTALLALPGMVSHVVYLADSRIGPWLFVRHYHG